MSDRPIATDALQTLGMIIDETQKRDAIHLAVIPVQAIEKCWPGQHVNEMGNTTPVPTSEFVGIVDPFLTGPVHPGQWFWLVIYPRKITSLRHVWSHPGFPEETLTTWLAPAGLNRTPAEMVDEIRKRKAKLTAQEHAENIENIKLETAKAFILREADGVGLSYHRLIDAANEFLDHGDYVVGGDEMEGACLSSEFWDHFETVTGRKVDPKDRGSFFSCSC
jgi:hypothetical protein